MRRVKPRTAAVHTFHYSHCTRQHPGGKVRKVPWLQLRGFWLQRIGFHCGDRYSIEVREQTLILRVINPKQKSA